MATKDLEYYEQSNKIFWIVNKDINEHIKANDKVPCIFVEKKEDNTRHIVQLDLSIKDDNYEYTAWRKVLGDITGSYIEVLLIHNGVLYTLKNEIVEFDTLGRSELIEVPKKYLSILKIKNKELE